LWRGGCTTQFYADLSKCCGSKFIFRVATEFFKIINESAEISTLDFFLKKYPLFVNLLLESVDGTHKIGTINNVAATSVK
jgi:hypothetical protein